MRTILLTSVVLALTATPLPAQEPHAPLHRTVELNAGETVLVELHDKTRAKVKLVDVQETRDTVRSALREARVRVEINGQAATLVAANYRLPVAVGGVQVDCTATRGLNQNSDRWEDSWGLTKDARLRLWPGGSPWMPPGQFVYPIKQKWFASATQMGNEPSHVDGGDAPVKRPIYYHNGLDIGGAEGMAEVVCATDGVVVSSGKDKLPGVTNPPVADRYDVVYVRDARDWYYRYSHLKTIDVKVGEKVKMGQRIGLLGKEGASGGWSHLHFDIKAKQPSGKWGTEEGYAFLWEAYVKQHKPTVIAVARPHHLIWAGESVTLDGSRSWSAAGKIDRYEWTLTDGSTAAGPRVARKYDKPGEYSEVVKVVDARGNVGYDFAVVLVIDKALDGKNSPTIHAAYAPTLKIYPGDPVTFKVRTYFTQPQGETWDFGDGTPPVQVRSDANAKAHAPDGYAVTVHRFARAGHYLVRAQAPGHNGGTVTSRLHVHVEERPAAGRQPQAVWEPWLDRKILPPDEAKAMLPAFVEQQIQPLPLPKTLDEWQARRQSLHQEVIQILGLDQIIPPKWDLKITNKGTLQRDGYRIEKLTFETYPGFANAAVLYVPDSVQGRVPGMVSISGHTRNSKSADYVQQRNVNLVKRGCVVLCYDYFGLNERNPGYPAGPNSHGIRSFSYTRGNPTTLEVLDAVRAIDVLAARPEVDPERIGFTGESGGSNSTYWIAAVDPRVKLAVAVSSVTTFDYWIRGDINWDWHQRPPGIRRVADIGTLLALHAPNPLVIVSSKRGTDDQEFPLYEAEKSHQWARHVYQLYQAGERVTHYESTTAHGYQEDKREQLYLAVEKWLKPPYPRDGKELPAAVEKQEDFRCGLPEDNQTLRSIFAEWVKPLPRTGTMNDPAEQRTFLRDRLGWPAELPAVKYQATAREDSGQWAAEFGVVETEPGIRLPMVRISPKNATAAAITLVPGRDRAAVARALARGRTAVAFDPRGAGETRSGKGGSWARMAGEPWPALLGDGGATWCNWSWFAGRPVPGQWALDITQVARWCRDRDQVKSVEIDADNDYGWPALLAGASMSELLASGRARVRYESLHADLRARGDGALADVPGLLERLDVPQLRQLWPGTVTVQK